MYSEDQGIVPYGVWGKRGTIPWLELYPSTAKSTWCSESTKVEFEGSKQPSEHCALHLLIKLVYKHCENIRQLFITRLLLEEWSQLHLSSGILLLKLFLTMLLPESWPQTLGQIIDYLSNRCISHRQFINTPRRVLMLGGVTYNTPT